VRSEKVVVGSKVEFDLHFILFERPPVQTLPSGTFTGERQPASS
jgi:hypothetical protein